MALDTTIGGTSSDSYGTLAAYEAYVVANINTAYTGTAATQELNLRRATQWLDRECSFIGMKQYKDQALSWPRLVNILVDGWPIDPDTVPDDIIKAQFEVAYLLETDGLDPFATIDGAIKRVMAKAGPVETETEYQGAKTTPRIIAVQGLLRDYLAGGTAGAQVRMLRG